jgi:hypothetical protein
LRTRPTGCCSCCRCRRAGPRQHGKHGPTFHHRTLLNNGDVGQGLDDAIDLTACNLRVRRFAPTESHQQTDLVALLNETAGRTGANVYIVVVRARAQPKLFQLYRVLMLLRFALFLRLLILRTAIIKELADGRDGVCRNLDEIKVFRPSHLQSLMGRHDAKLRPIFVDEPNFWDSNSAVDARAGRRPLWHVSGLDTEALLL